MHSFSELTNQFELSVDDFGKTTQVEGFYAIAKAVQSLILLQPGSYPNHPEMGVGIKDYQFEFLDRTTLDEIEERINEQISKYINSIYITEAVVDIIPNKLESKQNTIGVLLNFANLNRQSDTNTNPDSILLTFEQVEKKGQIKSQILI